MMQTNLNEFESYIANIRRAEWAGVAQRQLSTNVAGRSAGNWVYNPYDYSITMAAAYQPSRSRPLSK
jgi:hypothetical protein